jgi:hypothetical protein
VAKDYGAAVLLVSSTARENYGPLDRAEAPLGKKAPEPFGQGNPGRFIGLGKESGEIEFAADSLLVLGKDAEEAVAGSTSVALAVAKIRARNPDAPRDGWVRLRFDGTCFAEGPQDPGGLPPVSM